MDWMTVVTLAVPLILLGVMAYGLTQGVDVYSALLLGAGRGLQVVVNLVPPLVALLTVVQMLRASGALEILAEVLSPLLAWTGIPGELLPLMVIRPFSGSGALSVGAELLQTYGADSLIGRMASVMLGSTETTFYTVAVYFGAVGIGKTRYAIPAALLADATGFLVAAWSVRLVFGG